VLDAPYNLLAPLPRALWLPALVCSAGWPEATLAADRTGHGLADDPTRLTGQCLADVQRWRTALDEGALPPADAHFGAPAATAALRQATGQLGLPAICWGAEPMAEQLLRTTLWHLDRIAGLQPRLSQAQAIAQVTQEFTAAWTVLKGEWDAVMALLQGLGDQTRQRWDAGVSGPRPSASPSG
jgi:hypothetical protein